MGAYLSAPVTEHESEKGESNRMVFGSTSVQGWRLNQEDAHNCILQYDDNSSLFAVYDGHGGAEVAQYTAAHFPDFLRTLPAYKERRMAEALEEAFLQFDHSLTTKNVVAELRRISGKAERKKPAEDELDGEVDKRKLLEEAGRPLEEILREYGLSVQFERELVRGNKADEAAKAAKKRKKFMSPNLRAKKTKAMIGEGGDISAKEIALAFLDAAQRQLDQKQHDDEHQIENGETTDEGVSDSSEGAKVQSADGDKEPLVSEDLIKQFDQDFNTDNGGESTPSAEVKEMATTNGHVQSSTQESAATKDSKESPSKMSANNESNDATSAVTKAVHKIASPTSMRAKSNSVSAKIDEMNYLPDEPVTQRQRSSKSESNANEPNPDCPADATPETAAANADWESVSGMTESGSSGVGRAKKEGGGSPETATAVSSDDEQEEEDNEYQPKGEEDDEEASESEEDTSEDQIADDSDDSNEEGEDHSMEAEGKENDEGDSSIDLEYDMDDLEFQLPSGDTPGEESGTTACVVLTVGDTLYIANAGDSRCVLCRAGKSLDLSEDHKPEDPTEKSRIAKAGGKISADGRVNGGLNLSRAIGDHFYKKTSGLPLRDQMISSLPDIRVEKLTPEDTFMVLACDGIWNSMSSQEVVDFVSQRIDKTDLTDICQQLCDSCLAPNTVGDGTGCDNMTVIICKFKPNNEQQNGAVGDS